MTRTERWRKSFAEAWAMALSQRVASILTLVLVGGMGATVLLTAGRTAAAERAILASIDDAGSRAVVVRAEPKAGLDTTVVARLNTIEDAEWVGAFGAAQDATNGGTGGGGVCGGKGALYATDPALSTFPQPMLRGCYASTIDRVRHAGRRRLPGQRWHPVCDVTGRLTTPAFLAQFEPLVVLPQPSTAEQEPQVAIVVSTGPPSRAGSLVAAATTTPSPPRCIRRQRHGLPRHRPSARPRQGRARLASAGA